VKAGQKVFCAVIGLIAATIASPPVRASTLTFGCAGTVTRTYVLKNGVTTEPRKEPVSDYSVVLDLDKRVVHAFWYESTGHLIPSVPAALPIKEANAGAVSFAADRKIGRTEGHITGGVDRLTGAVKADDFTTFSGGASQHQNWDLHCRSR
jgi:hypothetical protein